MDLKYKRVVLKFSGEGLCGEGRFGIDGDELKRITREIKGVVDLGVQLCVVIGGGNIVRGLSIVKQTQIEEATAHHMGMLGTVINALAIQGTLLASDIAARVMGAFEIHGSCEWFDRHRAVEYLEDGEVVIFAGGTGNPYVTTDTCAALRAWEVKADVVLKATKVDGVYCSDPKSNPKAERHARLTFDEAIQKRLNVMDVSAFDLCQRSGIPIVVFNLWEAGNMAKVVCGKPIGTLVD